MNARQAILFMELLDGGLNVDPGPFILDENGFAVLDENGKKIYLEEHP